MEMEVDLVVGKVANMKVDKVSDMKVDMVADIEVDLVVSKVVNRAAHMVADNFLESHGLSAQRA